MAAIWNDATRQLARRLRPLYLEMSAEEFECMVARIAEIELHAEPASTPAVRPRTSRRLPMTPPPAGRGRAA